MVRSWYSLALLGGLLSIFVPQFAGIYLIPYSVVRGLPCALTNCNGHLLICEEQSSVRGKWQRTDARNTPSASPQVSATYGLALLLGKPSRAIGMRWVRIFSIPHFFGSLAEPREIWCLRSLHRRHHQAAIIDWSYARVCVVMVDVVVSNQWLGVLSLSSLDLETENLSCEELIVVCRSI